MHLQPKKIDDLSGEHFSPAEQYAAGNDGKTQPDISSARSPGTMIDGRFTIQSLLGIGGMSAVYKVHNIALGRTAALKMLHPHLLTERTTLERFIQEARAESSLKHPNVVSVHSMGVTADGALYLVMDFVDGFSLARLIEDRQRITAKEALPVFLEICSGLEAAHAKSILHRDLKPSNIMLSVKDDGGRRCVKIVDFGIAKFVTADASQRLTRAGSILGSPSYMSPEQCQGKSLDFRSDIYSLGCLMYECLTGKVPFHADSELELLCKHVSEIPPPFSQMAPDAQVCPDLQHAILRCLQKDPAQRYQTISALQVDLSSADLDGVVPVGRYCRSENKADSDVLALPEWGNSGARRKTFYSIAAVASVFALIFCWQYGCRLYQTRIHQPSLKKQAAFASEHFGLDSARSGSAWIAYGDALTSSGHFAAADSAYKNAIPSLAENIPAISFNRKLAIVDQALKGLPSAEVGVLHILFSKLLARKEYKEAESCARRSVELSATCDAWTKIVAASDLSMLLAQTGNFASAESSLRSLLTGDLSQVCFKDGLADIFTRAGNYAFNAKDFPRAIEYFKKSLALFAADTAEHKRTLSVNYRLIGDCYSCLSDLSMAKAFYQKAVDNHVNLDPSSEMQLREDVRVLADTMYSLNDLDGAQKNYRRALDLSAPLAVDGTSVSIKKGLADCHFRKSEYAAALPIYGDIGAWLDRNPNYPLDRALISRLIWDCRVRLYRQYYHSGASIKTP